MKNKTIFAVAIMVLAIFGGGKLFVQKTAIAAAKAETKKAAVLPPQAEKHAQTPKTIMSPLPGLSVVVCGNGVVESGEECDDGNKRNGDGCSCACAWEPDFNFPCGNGACEFGEARGQFRACERDCPSSVRFVEPRPHRAMCGNCVVEPGTGEVCDDGNLVSGDGCDATCHLDDMGLCSVASGRNLPEGVAFRDYPDARHISRCEGERSARYMICGRSGEITVSIGPCPEGAKCIRGECVVPLASSCTDSDGNDRGRVAGFVYTDGTSDSDSNVPRHEWLFDSCSEWDPQIVYEEVCPIAFDGLLRIIPSVRCAEGEVCSEVEVPCPANLEGCRAGRCAPGIRRMSCSDSDADDRGRLGGFVNGIDGRGDSYSLADRCLPDGRTVIEKVCSAIDGHWREISVPCGEGEICVSDVDVPCHSPWATECHASRCVPGVRRATTCTDSDGDDRGRIAGFVLLGGGDREVDRGADFCTTNPRMVAEFICREGRSEIEDVFCREGEVCREERVHSDFTDYSAARCVPETCSCSRTDAIGNIAGFVTGRDCVVQHDICEDKVLVQFRCGTGGMPEVANRTACAGACRDGLCVSE